jgi:signal peptidase I
MGRDQSHTIFQIFVAFRAYAEGIFLAILVALCLRNFVVTPYRVPNDVMAPNLLTGDFILAYRSPYGVAIPFSDLKWGEKMPRRGDLVVFPCFTYPQRRCVRRVVGLPGDRVEIRGERLVINGKMADYKPTPAAAPGFQFKESWEDQQHEILIAGGGGRENFGPAIVGPGSVFLLSDHRDLGEDSRKFGGVSMSKIEARVSLIWLSLKWPMESTDSTWPRVNWSRVFHTPH